MMTTLKALALLAHGVALACLATGCVRLGEPDHFICKSNADCDGNQKCFNRTCVDETFCNYSNDCDSGHHCASEHCVLDECASGADCKGFNCEGGVCRTSCTPGEYGCADGFHCASGQCVPGDPRANGQPCSTDDVCTSGKCCMRPSGSFCNTTCPTTSNDTCTISQDCLSRNCCKGPGGKSTCSAVPCSQVPECTSDGDCAGGRICQNQKCTERPPVKAVGQSCAMNSECASNTCFEGVCRGTRTQGAECAVTVDCEPHRLCCENQYSTGGWFCAQLDRGCPGSLGDKCEFDFECIDNDCRGAFGGFCSKPCSTNADCGVSPWGVPNACETNGLGDKICFPGCSSTQQCYDNLDGTFNCQDAPDSNAKFCATG